MSKQTRTIAIDFDGVLHRYSGYKGGVIDGPIKGARSAIGSLMRQGHTVVVFTTRDKALVEPWLAEHGFPPMHVSTVSRRGWPRRSERKRSGPARHRPRMRVSRWGKRCSAS